MGPILVNRIILTNLLAALLAIRAIEAAYGRINKYLVEEVDSDEVGANLAAASKWLKEHQNERHTFLSKIPISDLKKFTSLQSIVDDSRCDHVAYEILRTNERVVNLQQLIEENRVLRRVDKVLFQVFEQHSKRCLPIYRLNFNAKKLQLSTTTLKYVSNLGKLIMKADGLIIQSPEYLFQRYIRQPQIEPFEHKETLYEALIINAKKDTDVKYLRRVAEESTGKLVLHKDKIRELTRSYLIGPCEQFERELSLDLFIPARFDGYTYNEISNVNQDQDYREYYLGWSYYMICQALIKRGTAVYADIIKTASEH